MHTFLRCRRKQLLIAAVAVSWVATALGAAEPAPEIAHFVSQLGAPSLAARREAEEALLKFGAAALPALQAARESDNIEIRLRAAAIAGQINERRIAEAEIHVVGVYEAGAADRKVVVRIESSPGPVVLVVCARETVHWEVRLAEGVELLKVIASGYHPQQVLGTDALVQSFSIEGDDPPPWRDKAFYTYQSKGVRYEQMRERVQELTGKEPTSYQGRYDGEGKPFVIGQGKH